MQNEIISSRYSCTDKHSVPDAMLVTCLRCVKR